jgi:MoaA/NifB/PqqE/SkfB family radical SAM enzyme
MENKIIWLRNSRHKSLSSRLKNSLIFKFFKNTPLYKPLYKIYHDLDFQFRFKKFNYGTEFQGYICKLPFEHAEITPNGELSACCYLPKNFGNAYKSSVAKAWNSLFARQVRKSMLDGSFKYCDKNRCRSMQYRDVNLVKVDQIEDQQTKDIIQKSKVNMGARITTLSLAMDSTCNLECPSCRTGMIKISKDAADFHLLNFDKILKQIDTNLQKVHISGDGDPFASRVYNTLLVKSNWDRYPNLKIGIQTNGVALEPRKWQSLPLPVRQKISYIGISIDGATKNTYEKLRVRGNFEKLINNIRYLASMEDRAHYGIKLNLNMIVQHDNYREMSELINFGKEINVDEVGFTYLYNWGTFDRTDYLRHAVHLPSHPEHVHLLKMLSAPIFGDPVVDLGNLTYLLPSRGLITSVS